MESPLLQSSVAAAQLALCVRAAGTKQESGTPLKSETSSVRSELGTSPPSSVAWFVFYLFFTSRFLSIYRKIVILPYGRHKHRTKKFGPKTGEERGSCSKKTQVGMECSYETNGRGYCFSQGQGFKLKELKRTHVCFKVFVPV